jgi:hypothetical protein
LQVINSLGNNFSALLLKLYNERNVTINTILSLIRLTWASVVQLSAKYNPKMFFVAKSEKISNRKNKLIRNIFKLYLEVGIVIEEETEDFQNEVRMILFATRKMIWSITKDFEFMTRNEDEKYEADKMLKFLRLSE